MRANLTLKQVTQGVSKYILLPTSLVHSLTDPLYIPFLIVTTWNMWILSNFQQSFLEFLFKSYSQNIKDFMVQDILIELSAEFSGLDRLDFLPQGASPWLF